MTDEDPVLGNDELFHPVPPQLWGIVKRRARAQQVKDSESAEAGVDVVSLTRFDFHEKPSKRDRYVLCLPPFVVILFHPRC